MSREWSPRWPKERTADVKTQVMDWLKKNKLAMDAHVYSQEEWRDRGEKWWEGTVAVIAAEGAFNHLMNYPETKEAQALVEEFRNFLDSLDLWAEQGYSWTWHLYPQEPRSKMGEGTPGGRTILHVLGDLAMPKRKLVLTQGDRYWRIEDLIAQVRRDEKSGDERTQRALAEPVYTSDVDADDRVVIWRATPAGKKAHFVEYGSKIATDPV